MEDSIIELTCYCVIMPIRLQPQLDIVEKTVLQYLREDKTPTQISEILGFNIEHAMAELKEKEIINQNLKFNYINNQDWIMFAKKEYKKCYIFYDNNKEMFYDNMIYPHELKFHADLLLGNYLGDDYLSNDILSEAQILNDLKVNYKPKQYDKNSFTRKISSALLKCCICKEC